MFRKFTFISLIFSFTLFFSCTPQKPTSTFSFEPAYPNAGSKIMVSYVPDSTKLMDAESVTMKAFLYNTKLFRTVGVDLKNTNGWWQGEFTLPDSAYGALIVFTNDNVIDNNDKNGYVIKVCDNSGKESAAALAGYAVAFSEWSYYPELDNDYAKALEMLNTACAENPELKVEFASQIIRVLTRGKAENADAEVDKIMMELEKIQNPTEDQLITLAGWTQKGEAYRKILDDKFPFNRLNAQSEFSKIRAMTNTDEKFNAAEKFAADFSNSYYRLYLFDYIAQDYAANKEYETLKEYLDKHAKDMHEFRFASISNSILENGNTEMAEFIAQLGVKLSEENIKNPTEEQDEGVTEKEWLEAREQTFASNLAALGKVQIETNNPDAVTNLKRAVDIYKSEDADINLDYVNALVKFGKAGEAVAEMEKFIKSAKANQAMKDLLKESFIANNGSDENFDKYLSGLEQEALAGLIKELRTRMLNEPAPLFTLTDLNGKTVSLADFKGKTVVVDFWAVWCGPCKASFPGMKKTVERFADDESMKFLFVNAWESGNTPEAKSKRAEDFITENKYPFHVLMDFKDKTIADYGVSGIPTKFVIGPDGNIKFKEIGFDGNTDHIPDQITAMVMLARGS